ncbi:hypothetical protein DSL72_007611 [Monilinia vaccinii-corymbosi]|uniref:Uncharacterized protein n=1 Tax=Monilinia vaccinii-corymbosi TaxID=61207 RepID=A0A8A3PI94_9HELO|nr:hypothetical protein DSL72_007611 [Monilinia vaccinii-corymbosi]
MATDMDIDMDIDVGVIEGLPVPDMVDIELIPDQPSGVQDDASAPNDSSGPDAEKPTPEKVHIRGVDNLTTEDVKKFAQHYFTTGHIERVEWIDDSSLNLVYSNSEVAEEALRQFTAQELPEEISQLPILQPLITKPFPDNERICLQVRLAVVGDRKQRGARERSRFYLFNPEHDPAERRKREGGRRYRDRDDDGYRSQRYDEREQRNRQRGDAEAGFDASIYDDDEAALATRSGRSHGRSGSGSSGSDFRERVDNRRGSGSRELFPDRGGNEGRLRGRSASPIRNEERARDYNRRRGDTAAAENRLKAQAIKARLHRETSTKELFPSKLSTSRTSVFDTTDETADLFANRMPVPFVDGSSDVRPSNKRSLAERITSEQPHGFSIRGTAKPASTGFSIKGLASERSTTTMRELFPERAGGGNSGKELFSERLVGRGGRRQKAEDLFH